VIEQPDLSNSLPDSPRVPANVVGPAGAASPPPYTCEMAIAHLEGLLSQPGAGLWIDGSGLSSGVGFRMNTLRLIDVSELENLLRILKTPNLPDLPAPGG
jgi:hypothetical protein